MKKLTIILLIVTLFIFSESLFGIYKMLEVDGIKVNIQGIQFSQGYDNPTRIARFDLNQTVDLTGDLSDVVSADVTIQFEEGVETLEFNTMTIEMINGVDIKAHGYDSDSGEHIYTSSTGIQTINLGTSTWTEQSDYDYLHLDYFYYPESDSEEGRASETTFLNEMRTIADSETLEVSLLVDTYQVAYYWDGTHADRHNFVETVPLSSPSTFPTGTPVLSITYLPFYVVVNQDVVSETYTVSDNASKLPDANGDFDVKEVMYVTLTFDNTSGDFYIGRTANWDGLSISFSLNQFVNSATYNSTYRTRRASRDGGESARTGTR